MLEAQKDESKSNEESTVFHMHIADDLSGKLWKRTEK